jgi:hypothetical protein
MNARLHRYFPCKGNDFYDFTQMLIQKHKPDRIFFSYWWETLLANNNENGPLHENGVDCRYATTNDKSYKDILYDIEKHKKTFKSMKDLGYDIYVATLNPTVPRFNPSFMLDGYVAIE